MAEESEKQLTALARHRESLRIQGLRVRARRRGNPPPSFCRTFVPLCPAAPPHICPCQKYCISRCTNTVSAVTLLLDLIDPVTAPA